MLQENHFNPSQPYRPQSTSFYDIFREMWEQWQKGISEDFSLDDSLSQWQLDYDSVVSILSVTRRTLDKYRKDNELVFCKNPNTGTLYISAGVLQDRLFNGHFLPTRQMHIAALSRLKNLLIELNWHIRCNPKISHPAPTT